MDRKLDAALAASAEGTLRFARDEGSAAQEASASAERSILIAALLSGLVALALAV